MKIYFLSSTPCELTLNGVFYGVTDRFERFVSLSLSDGIFAKFTPQGGLPVGLFINEELLQSPPNGVEIYLLPDSVAIYVKDFPPADFLLRPITQARFDKLLVTVFQQGHLQLSIQTEKNFFIRPLPHAFSTCTLSFRANLIFVEGEKHLAVFTQEGECLFLEEILQFSCTENELVATLPLSDVRSQIAVCTYTLSERGLERTGFTLQARGENERKIKAELLAYAFFESVLLGLDYTQFLGEELKEKASDLPAFLGKYSAVTLTENPLRCGLVYAKNERVFEVRYFSVKVENGEILDVYG